jgi:hypothetical protein
MPSGQGGELPRFQAAKELLINMALPSWDKSDSQQETEEEAS